MLISYTITILCAVLYLAQMIYGHDQNYHDEITEMSQKGYSTHLKHVSNDLSNQKLVFTFDRNNRMHQGYDFDGMVIVLFSFIRGVFFIR